jgi:hypothetical protein
MNAQVHVTRIPVKLGVDSVPLPAVLLTGDFTAADFSGTTFAAVALLGGWVDTFILLAPATETNRKPA